jgi:hypothetical protein
MIIPKYEALIGRLVGEAPLISCALGPARPRCNPRHYKFYWRIFTLESRYQGHTFVRRAPRLCTARYLEEIARLDAARKPALIYGLKLPRLDTATPFDLNHPK